MTQPSEPMKCKFIPTPGADFACNAKAASSSFVRAIIAAHMPELEEHISTAVAYPTGKGPDDVRWQGRVDGYEQPKQPVVLVVRGVVERFRSACAESGVAEVDAKLAKLESAPAGIDPHFCPQARYVEAAGKAGQPVRLYRFERDLDAAAKALGLALPLPVIKTFERIAPPTLTPAQQARVLAIYAADAAIWDAAVTAGVEWVDPAAAELRRAEQLALISHEAAAAIDAGIEVDGGIRLAAAPADQLAFALLLNLLREAEALQPDDKARAAFLATPQLIADAGGTLRTVSDIPALRRLLVSYGEAIRGIWNSSRAAAAALR